MEFTSDWRRGMAMLAILGVFAQTSFAAVPGHAPRNGSVGDVALRDDGTLVGLVVDSTGMLLVDRTVSLRQNGRLVTSAQTGRNGRFAVPNLKPGVYQLVTDRIAGNVRIWPATLAPPAASPMIRVVHPTGQVVRGQNPDYAPDIITVIAIGALITGVTLGIIELTEDDHPRGS